MKFYSGILALCLLGGKANAFVVNANSRSSNAIIRMEMAVSAEESAKAFTDYMAKSHVEKLKAMKDLETKKNAEIEALKSELDTLKGGDVVLASAPAVAEGSVEDLSAKLLAYQKFMSEYIVKAQEEKYKAIKAAEESIAKKYEDKLNAFMLPGAADAAAPAALPSKESKEYQERNANIKAAAKAGKSRWGDKEVEKVGGVGVVKKSSKPAATAAAYPTASTSPDTIAAADKGLRADGGVGGLTLEQRLTSGAGDIPANGAAVPGAQTSMYDLRNASIAKAAKAGKQSRWGNMEEKKAVEKTNALPAADAPQQAAVKSTPEIEAADHGLRADGGVTGPSLAERVNLGAQLLQ